MDNGQRHIGLRQEFIVLCLAYFLKRFSLRGDQHTNSKAFKTPIQLFFALYTIIHLYYCAIHCP